MSASFSIAALAVTLVAGAGVRAPAAAAATQPQPQAPDREAVARAASAVTAGASDVASRKAAAALLARDRSTAAVASLWLLAHDSDRQVRRAVLAALASCPEADPLCVPLWGMLIDDTDPEVSWSARDLLLFRAPEVALFAAPAAYKKDAISLLAKRMQRDGMPAIEPTLRLLTTDEDPEIRAAARQLQGFFD